MKTLYKNIRMLRVISTIFLITGNVVISADKALIKSKFIIPIQALNKYGIEPLDEFLKLKLRDTKEPTYKKLKELEKSGKIKNVVEYKGDFQFDYEFKETERPIKGFGVCSFNMGKLYNIHLEAINDKYPKTVEKIYNILKIKYGLNETITDEDKYAEKVDGANEMSLIFYVFEGQANLIVDFIAKEIQLKRN